METAMDHLMLWNPEDWTTRETYEHAILQVGGVDLDTFKAQLRTANEGLGAMLDREQREAFVAMSDATSDAWSHRETSATRVALAHGIAIGAALSAFPEDDPEKVARVASGIAGVLLTGGLPPSVAQDVTRIVMEALQRADEVAALPKYTGGHYLRLLPIRVRPGPGTAAGPEGWPEQPGPVKGPTGEREED